jgi:hypothetical protein
VALPHPGTAARARRPFVRLFFECVTVTGGEGLTAPWLEISADAGERLGITICEEEL